MGKWSSFSGIGKTSVDKLQGAVEAILKDYAESIYWYTESGLSAAEKILLKKMKANTPKKTGSFRKGWKGTGRKYKMRRFVGNTTVVTGENGETISLANIFEYSLNKGRPFIKRTFENSIDEMAAAIVAEISNG